MNNKYTNKIVKIVQIYTEVYPLKIIEISGVVNDCNCYIQIKGGNSSTWKSNGQAMRLIKTPLNKLINLIFSNNKNINLRFNTKTHISDTQRIFNIRELYNTLLRNINCTEDELYNKLASLRLKGI